MLRAAQAARFVGAVERRDGAVGPHDPPLRGHVARPLVGRRDRQDAAVALDHHIAGILGGWPDQGDAVGARLDPRPDIFGAGPGLAEAASGEQQPDPPIARRRQLARPRPLAPDIIDFGELVGARRLDKAALFGFRQCRQRSDQRCHFGPAGTASSLARSSERSSSRGRLSVSIWLASCASLASSIVLTSKDAVVLAAALAGRPLVNLAGR